MNRVTLFLLLPFVAVACQDVGPTDPVDDPELVQLAGKPDCLLNPTHPSCKDGDGGGDGIVVASASGDYWMTVERYPDRTDQKRWTWFDAKKYDDGTVVGEWRVERFNIDSGRRVSKASGKISCFTIIGGEAWLGGTQQGVPKVINNVLWRVVDGNPDDSSLACNRMPHPEGYPGCWELAGYDSEMYCELTPPYPGLGPPIDSGDVALEVRSPQ